MVCVCVGCVCVCVVGGGGGVGVCVGGYYVVLVNKKSLKSMRASIRGDSNAQVLGVP